MRFGATRAVIAFLLVANPGFAADCDVIDAIDSFASTDLAPHQATCATYLTVDATTGASCHWSFAFRDAAALDFSDSLLDQLKACRTGMAKGADQQVNHPDSYDLRQVQGEDGTYAISVKDKGALNLTLVFLRFEPK